MVATLTTMLRPKIVEPAIDSQQPPVSCSVYDGTFDGLNKSSMVSF